MGERVSESPVQGEPSVARLATCLPPGHELAADVSVVIVNWNTCALLAGCLRSLLESTGGFSYDVLVVDNASADGSPTMLRRDFPQVSVVESGGNLGFARANNLAFDQVTGEFVLLLNPDTRLAPDAVARLLAAMRGDPALAGLGAQLLKADGSLQPSGGRFPSLVGELPLLRRFAGSGGPPRPQSRSRAHAAAALDSGCVPLDWAKGACLLLRREALRQVGWLDEDYWLYTEEADWCYRARRAGWEIAILPAARVWHYEQAASRQRAAHSLRIFCASRALFLRKHASPLAARALWLTYALKSVMWLARPRTSPLGIGTPELSDSQIRSAYVALLARAGREVLAPVPMRLRSEE
jgi:N-acetylglucosaminyl-diphospho-decaprenol L-rhamnosyltransferase